MPTSRRSRANPDIREFILRNVEKHPEGLTALVGSRFGVSREAVNRYVRRLVQDELLIAEGNTYARRYKLREVESLNITIPVTPGMYEHEVWQEHLSNKFASVPANIVDICQYGFTEMFNNVIDHSESGIALLYFSRTYDSIEMRVMDRGVGIFEKIQKYFNLPDARSAILELSKGKLTSDKAHHSGEGIFFTSRMFDDFYIMSSALCYQRHHQEEGDEWAIEIANQQFPGTMVEMKIYTNAEWTTKGIFDKYQDDEYRFTKTHVPIFLGRYGDEQLVSRSQAKRVLVRFENFSEVFLDFNGVSQIGQAFADEIFRVFKNEHPEVRIIATRTNPEIDQMIERAQSRDDPAPLLPGL